MEGQPIANLYLHYIAGVHWGKTWPQGSSTFSYRTKFYSPDQANQRAS
jgi:hypothetical protein